MSEPFELELAEGEKHPFPGLTVPEYAALQARVAAAAKKENRLLADESGFTPMDRARFLRESDPRSIGVYEVETYLNDDRNARAVLRQSLAKAGKTADEAESIVAKITVVERCLLAKHVSGLVNLSPVPEEDRIANDRMRAAILKHFPGANVETMTVGEFFNLISLLAPPPDDATPEGWFKANTVAGSEKKLI